METHPQQTLNAKKVLALILGAITIYVAVSFLVNDRFNKLEELTRSLLADQQATLVAIAETTARNGADTVTESVIRDCMLTERSEFDTLLSQLDRGLSYAELTTLERLFGRCGSFYAERKAVMVARLAREIEVYETYVLQLNTVVQDDLSETFEVKEWQALATEEKKQSELFAQLVTAQDKIIVTLLAGSSASSPEIQAILQDAREIQEALFMASKQASDIRAILISL
ncbi:hypothetical protein GW937_00680 [Candidatus Kaiserbacteria bacterium]|nr:hypothetical protein [Candidatus Kaiserbacteria bacterium]NCT01869.1 hypothetical protein [Candidatus Parcubacteria bacterium]